MIISKVSGRKYSAMDALKKFLIRGDMTWNFDVKETFRSRYGDRDMMLEGWILSEPQMMGSPKIAVRFRIPAHHDYAGKISISWGCGENPGVWKEATKCKVQIYEITEEMEDAAWERTCHVMDLPAPAPAWSFEETHHEGAEIPEVVELLEILKEALLRGMIFNLGK